MDLHVLGENKKKYWVATCLEFNLVAQGRTFDEALKSLEDAIEGYVQTVFNTDDALSIPDLLHRPAPLSKRLLYHIVKSWSQVGKWEATSMHPKIPTHAAA